MPSSVRTSPRWAEARGRYAVGITLILLERTPSIVIMRSRSAFETATNSSARREITRDREGSAAERDLCHRGHARVEDHIREAKDCGLSNLPFQSFAHNQVWLWLVMAAQDLIAWTKALCLTDQARVWELKRLRYRYADLAVTPTLI